MRITVTYLDFDGLLKLAFLQLRISAYRLEVAEFAGAVLALEIGLGAGNAASYALSNIDNRCFHVLHNFIEALFGVAVFFAVSFFLSGNIILAERGIVKNENATVTALVSREEAQIAQIDELLESRFDGSLPAFVAAFSKRQKLSDEKLAEILRIIGE